jgi:hypothetical protein
MQVEKQSRALTKTAYEHACKPFSLVWTVDMAQFSLKYMSCLLFPWLLLSPSLDEFLCVPLIVFPLPLVLQIKQRELKEWKLGSINDRDHMAHILLVLDFITQYSFSSSICLPENHIISFFPSPLLRLGEHCRRSDRKVVRARRWEEELQNAIL